MRKHGALIGCVLVALVLVAQPFRAAFRPVVAAPADPPKTTNADVTTWMTELSNWGRWGKADQIGTLNLITPEKRKAAMKLARDGVSVSLAHTLDKEQFPDNPRPLVQQMTIDNTGHAMDLYTMLAIVAMGLPLVDVMDLEAAAAAPVPVPGGTGFPLNPIATF